MSNTTTTVTPSDIAILEASYMSATVSTRSGSHYTVITRPSVGVVLINETRGLVARGTTLRIIDGRMYLLTNGQVIASTTRLTQVYILEN